jgi:pimeloyl-ACP methyl ester carboxylesterase
LIRGYQSDVLSDQGARELLNLVTHAHYVVLNQAGHMVAGDRNTIFTEAVLGFLQASRTSPRNRAASSTFDHGAST